MRTCDPTSARAAAESCLRGVEQLNVEEPDLDEGEREEQARGREQMQLMVKNLLGTLSMAAAAKWGGHWVVSDKEADSIASPAVEVIELELGTLANDPWSRLWMALGMFAVPRMVLSMGGASSSTSSPAQSAPTSSTIDVEATVTKEEP